MNNNDVGKSIRMLFTGAGKLSGRFRNFNIILFAVAFVVIMASMLLAFNNINRKISFDFARSYGVSTANALSAHINKEIGFLAKAARSESVIEWLTDEDNPDKKDRAYKEMAEILRELYSGNLYVGVEKSRREYAVTEDYTIEDAIPFAGLASDNPDDAWYFRAIESENDYWLNVGVDRLLDRKRVWLNYKIVKDGVPIGVLCNGLEFPHVAKELFSLSDDLNARGFIINENGLILIDSVLLEDDHFMHDPMEIHADEALDDRVLLAAIQSHLDRINGFYDEKAAPILVHPLSKQYRYATITPITNTKWSVVTMYDPSALLGMSRFLPAFAVVLLLLVAVIMATNAISYRLIVMPLTLLVQSLSRLKENHGEKVYGLARDDEFGCLSNTISDLFNEANHDALTGVFNRRFMETTIQQNMGLLSRSNGILSVAMVDIDFFKLYNDHYGHQEGDNCLKAVSKAMADSVGRSSDFVARYGGEEFIAVLPNTDETGAIMIANNILENVRALKIPHAKSTVDRHVTVSVGITTGKVTFPQNWKEYVKRADDALYLSKRNGRNRFTYVRFL